MITVFSKNEQNVLVEFQQPLEKALWIDVYDPTEEERLLIESETRISMPLHHEMHQLEFSNRFYEENGIIYMSLSTVTRAAPLPESHIVTFILSDTQLITLRYSEPNPIKTYMEQLEHRQVTVKDHYEICGLLFGTFVGRIADIFELVGAETESLSLTIENIISGSLYSGSSDTLSSILGEINRLENLISKTFQSISGLSLTMGFMQQFQSIQSIKHLIDQFPSFTQDIQNLRNHGDHLNQKLGFQLQSALGVINIQQNQIIKVFTVLAMIFMPPTLIASIYGMNFHHLPELNFTYGYPIALVTMLISSLLPYLFFKRKGWI